MSTYSDSHSSMTDHAPSIVHLDLDTFFVSVERLLDPKLQNRPVIVGGNPYGRGVVAGCSYEARAYGVHSAQPIRLAHRLCPQAAFLHGSYIHYAEYSRLIGELLTEIVPICERASVDEFYLDLSRCESLKGSAYAWAQEIQRMLIGETHLPLSLGVATNKLIAKVATTQVAKRSHMHAHATSRESRERHHFVEAGTEAGFLAPFVIRAMPGIGEVTEERLVGLGIQRIGQLATTPVQVLQRLFGKSGRVLHDKAHGIDHSPVIITREQKSYSREQTFSEDTLEAHALFSILLKLASDLGSDLRESKVFAGKLTLKLRYSDFTTVTRAIGCSYTNNDQEIYRIAKKLFMQLWTRRVRVRLLGIEATQLLDDIEQMPLFTPELERKEYLRRTDSTGMATAGQHLTGYAQRTIDHAVLDGLRSKYGKAIIGYAGAVNGRAKSHEHRQEAQTNQAGVTSQAGGTSQAMMTV